MIATKRTSLSVSIARDFLFARSVGLAAAIPPPNSEAGILLGKGLAADRR
jgi:hypothetical protein